VNRPPRKPKPEPRRSPATDAAEAAARAETILRLRLDGGQFHDLAVYANDPSAEACAARGGPPWNLTPPDLWKLIHRADDILIARTERKRGRAVALQLARRDALYLRAINTGDYAVALSILRDQATILGMYPQVAELRKLVKAQDKMIQELEAATDAPREVRSIEAGAGAAGEGADGGEPAEEAPEE
jgi:hypothetical protein